MPPRAAPRPYALRPAPVQTLRAGGGGRPSPYMGGVTKHGASVTAVTINGEARDVDGGATIAAMLRAIGLDPARVAVERNREIVPRSTLAAVMVEDGDQFEIVHFVGGG